jgi:hypothetical protein
VSFPRFFPFCVSFFPSFFLSHSVKQSLRGWESKNIPPFTEPEVSLPCSQESAIGPYSDPHESTFCHYIFTHFSFPSLFLSDVVCIYLFCFVFLGQLVKWDALQYTSVYQKVSGLAAWSENCKWYSSLPLGAVVSSLFCESV